MLLSVLAGHRRYARITALRGDPVNPPLLGMRKVLSEDAVRRNLGKIEEEPGLSWLQEPWSKVDFELPVPRAVEERCRNDKLRSRAMVRSLA